MKGILKFLLGLGLGGGLGFFGGMAYEQHKKMKKTTEVERIRVSRIRMPSKNINGAMTETGKALKKKCDDILNENGYAKTVEAPDMDQMSEEMNKAFAELEGPGDAETPFCITEQEYSINMHDYAQDLLYFYTVDEIVTDAEDELVEDPEELIGDEIMRMLHEGKNHDSTIFVQNDDLRTLYQISIVVASYENIHGIEY